MHLIYGTRIVRALRYSGQLVRQMRNDVASLRPATVDAIIISIFGVIIFTVEYYYDLAPQLFQFGMDYREWEVDNLIFVVFAMSIGFAIFSYRRVKELAVEMKARRSAELGVTKLSRHDPLTGLPNRRFFVEMLGEVLLKTTGASRSAVLMLDLDGFKSINDAYGHAVGDEALTQFAERVSAIMRSGAILTRVGGDEFAIIVPDISSLDDPTALARRIVAAVGDPFLLHHI